MNVKKAIGLVWAVAIAVVAQGAEVESVKSATGQGVSIFDPATWGISGDLSSADDYILKHNGISVNPSRYMDATTKVATFPGNSLHLRASFQPDGYGYVLEFPRAGLFFDQNGIFRTWDTSTTPRTIGVTGTAITVTSPDSAPAKIMSTAAPPGVMTFDFRAPLNGAVGTRLQVQRYSNATYPGTVTLRLLNACTNFFGTIRLEGNKSTLVLGTPEFPGTVRLCYTTAGKTGFITALYVILVPLLGLILKQKIRPIFWACVVASAIGLYLLCIPVDGGFGSVNKGDLIILLCSLMFAFHILTIDYFSPKVNGVKLSCIQFFVAGGLSCLLMFIIDPALGFSLPTWANIQAGWFEILYAGIMSCGVAYTLQVVGQKDVEPTLASMILCLESVFAVIAGAILLGETMGPREIIGCVLMFVAIMVAQLPSKDPAAEIEKK